MIETSITDDNGMTYTGAAAPLPPMDPVVDDVELQGFDGTDVAAYDDLSAIDLQQYMPAGPLGWAYLGATTWGGYWAAGKLAESYGMEATPTYRAGGALAGLIAGVLINAKWLNY
ncbi:MAG: hypothetical protein ACYS7M_16130 [Planctomycetota bacterium]|jgi:hypothetical protein